MSTKNLFAEEIESELQALSGMELGTDTYNDTVTGISKLSQQLIELERLQAEEVNRDIELRKLDIEETKAEMEAKNNKSKNCIALLTTGLTIGVGIWATMFSWKKEEGGSMTYTAGKRATDSLLSIFRK